MENKLKVLNVLGKYTGLRHSIISENSGEEFYHKFLNYAFYESFVKKEKLEVDLDGVRGYSPSFIDEAFGNLVFDFKLENVKKYLIIKSEDFDYWIKNIYEDTYDAWESKRIKNELPRKTEDHKPWWRIINTIPEKSVWEKKSAL
ncbi:STAS-like domain-containing protein [Adhaeribacter radiodurans]|uniref:STAS-like domain-containing protein n=2 Tax=Adhaeribacter radiodurans TaxID=2745197 RepID=A0A7L7LGA1_9BACT|nr:STAS-like domain-containing protein [Adhaeribacter radiodurans]